MSSAGSCAPFPAALWPEISRRLDEALSLGAAQRGPWLERLAETDPAVAAHVRRLLAAHDRPAEHDPLRGPPSELVAAALSDPSGTGALAAGQMVGPYRLLAPIGEGGMASVWLAEQTQNVVRRVALKIPHRGLEDTAAATARFQHERDLLAGLEHRHIGRLYDAGIAEGGQPYLAMEWIDGVPITRYADAERLTVAQRVALFQQVLQAVRHAHVRLVIHRDLKPSNILVTAEGQVKLLDFGIARLLGEGPGDAGATGARLGLALTPETASPEQLAGEVPATPSDVYSLGVVLYELLAGRRPYRLEPGSGERSTPALHARVLAATITPPSETALDEAVASARGSSVRRLRRTLSGDLDAIVCKALMKRPEQRYEGADGLQADLVRWSEGRPVEARRATLGYRAGRFLWRNRGAVAAGGAVVLALCVGLGIALWQAERARQETRVAQSVQTFLVKLFDANDPEQARGHDIGARELLARGSKRLDSELQDQPAVLARLEGVIGGIYIQLGDNVTGKSHLERALALYERTGTQGSEEAIDIAYELAESLEEEMQYDEARRAAARCLARAEASFGPRNRWRLPVGTHLAWMLLQEGHTQAAIDAVTLAIADAERDDPGGKVQLLKARRTLGTAYLELGELVQARDVFAQLVHDGPLTPGHELTDQLVDRYNLARARDNLEEFATAASELATLVPEMDQHIGAAHDRTIKARSLWAQSLAELGEYGRAVDVQRENLEHTAARPSVDADVLSLQQLTLAKLLKIAMRPKEGLPLAIKGLAFMDAKYLEPYWNRVVARRLLAELLLESGRIDEALEQLDTAASQTARIDRYASNTRYADLLQVHAMALHLRLRPGDEKEAEGLLLQACSIYARALAPDNRSALRCAAHLSWLQALGRPGNADARAAFRQAAAYFESTLPAEHVAHAELLLMYAELDRRAGDTKDAHREQLAGQAAWAVAMHAEYKPPFVGLH